MFEYFLFLLLLNPTPLYTLKPNFTLTLRTKNTRMHKITFVKVEN